VIDVKTVVKFDDIKNSELQKKVYETVFRIKELKISDKEFQKALEYFSYVVNGETTIDNIINRNELSLREFEVLKHLLEIDDLAKKNNVEIVSMTTLLKSVGDERFGEMLKRAMGE
jgi:CRISPR/Cas system-associated protein Cas10 (large subunit of type III CRISPR-Cas system)